MEYWRKIWTYAFEWGSWAELPNLEKLFKKLVENSMETCKVLRVFTNYEPGFT